MEVILYAKRLDARVSFFSVESREPVEANR
jgi:hypothetical protein